jgi:hypothetical protein
VQRISVPTATRKQHSTDIGESDNEKAMPWVSDYTKAYRKELLVHIFLTENVCNLPILGKVDPLIVFQGDLLWNSPGGDIDIFHLYGPINESFGREAYLAWKQK